MDEIKRGRALMKFVLILLAILGFLGVLGLLIRKRKLQRSQIESAYKHSSSGLMLYHRRTRIKVRPALRRTEATKQQDTPRVAVIEFRGDLRASKRFDLSCLFDEIYLNRDLLKELVLKIESAGGGVAEYGFLYAELERLRQRCENMQIVVCVDTVAASGGYLMSLPAHKIYAAPFSMIGSIGVVSFVPNIRKLLEKWNIEPRTFTAGDYKRTVTLTDDASPEEIEHYKRQLALIHDQFKAALSKYRPCVKVEQVATGELWLASTTVEQSLGLVDGLRVSSDYLMDLNQQHDLLFMSFERNKDTWMSRLRKISRELKELFGTYSR
jgi:serine protease SohB